MAEYVKLSYAEKKYGEKNLLQSQLQLLNSIKHLKEYKKLRKQELLLKIKLKEKVIETIDELKMLDKRLPKVQPKHKISRKENKENLSLENELEKIKNKLKALQ